MEKENKNESAVYDNRYLDWLRSVPFLFCAPLTLSPFGAYHTEVQNEGFLLTMFLMTNVSMTRKKSSKNQNYKATSWLESWKIPTWLCTIAGILCQLLGAWSRCQASIPCWFQPIIDSNRAGWIQWFIETSLELMPGANSKSSKMCIRSQLLYRDVGSALWSIMYLIFLTKGLSWSRFEVWILKIFTTAGTVSPVPTTSCPCSRRNNRFWLPMKLQWADGRWSSNVPQPIKTHRKSDIPEYCQLSVRGTDTHWSTKWKGREQRARASKSFMRSVRQKKRKITRRPPLPRAIEIETWIGSS